MRSPGVLAERAVSTLAAVLDRRTSRRGFLARVAVAGSALTVAPLVFALRPVSAYDAVCQCGDPSCGCGSACCDGYSEFCCVLYGENVCPPGTFTGGWWRADGSIFCPGARYYIDCNASCHCDGDCADGSPFCGPSCDGLTCGCGLSSCSQRQAGCITFRYGQCHEEIGCAGRIACRLVTCTPPWELDATCSTTTFFDDNTADQNAPCLQAPQPVVSYAFAAHPKGGFYLAETDGTVHTYDAPFFGSPAADGNHLDSPVVAIAASPTGDGYWLATAAGNVFNFGVPWHGSPAADGNHLDSPVVAIAASPTGDGYWLATAGGAVLGYAVQSLGGPAGQPGGAGVPVVGIAVDVSNEKATGYTVYGVGATPVPLSGPVPPPAPVFERFPLA